LSAFNASSIIMVVETRQARSKKLTGPVGIFVIASLILKRHFETHKRPWKIWIWDVGKQLVGQTVLHGLNLLVCLIFAYKIAHIYILSPHHLALDLCSTERAQISGLLSIDHNNNPCSAYLLNILIDTTIGVLIIYFALKHATWFFSVYLGKEGYESGQYGHPPQAILYVSPYPNTSTLSIDAGTKGERT
jgi:hypothetical protein